MTQFTFADAERVCYEAIKAMLLAERRELTEEFLLAELAEQHARIALAEGRRNSEQYQ